MVAKIYNSNLIVPKNQFHKISEEQFTKDCAHLHWFSSSVANYNDIKLPKRATIGSAGYDFYSLFDFILNPGESIKLPTAIKVELVKSCVLLCYPRSSLGFKYKLMLDNTVGVIDSDYYNNENNEGHIWVSLTNYSDKILEVKKGEAIFQGIITQYFVTDDDSVSEIRTGGMGSTNKEESK